MTENILLRVTDITKAYAGVLAIPTNVVARQVIEAGFLTP